MLANAGAAARDRTMASQARHHDAGTRKTQKESARAKSFCFRAEHTQIGCKTKRGPERAARSATLPRVLEPLPSGAVTSRRQVPAPKDLGAGTGVSIGSSRPSRALACTGHARERPAPRPWMGKEGVT